MKVKIIHNVFITHLFFLRFALYFFFGIFIAFDLIRGNISITIFLLLLILLFFFSISIILLFIFFFCFSLYIIMQSIKVIEPRANVVADEQKNHVVLQGGLRYTEQVHTADSSQIGPAVPSQALWTIYPPSTQTIVDRLVKVRVYVEVESKSGDFQIGTNDAPRQFPLHAMTETLTVQINGESISDNIGDKLSAMLAYGNTRADRNKTWSTTCAMPDQYQQLSDWTTYGSGKNPLAEYGENSAEDPRGGFTRKEMVAGKKYQYIITEPILMSPFYDGLGHQVEGMVNVNQINIAYRFKTDVGKFWTHSSAGNLIDPSDLVVTFYQQPEVITTYITPDLTQPLPRLLTLPYHKTQDYLKKLRPLGVGEVDTFYSDSIKLSQIPRRMYLFVRKSRGTKNMTDADAFAGIKKVSILWNNESGLIGNAKQEELYEISRRNGLNMSWSQFSRHRGSVVCIEFGSQIGLLDNEAPGVRGQYTIQVKVDVENLSGEAGWTGDFYTLMLMEGTFQISENMGRATLGNLTSDVVFNAKSSPELHFSDYAQLRGDGFFSSLKSFINKVARGVQKTSDFGQKVAPALVTAFPELAPVASALPSISRGAQFVRSATGGALSGGRLSGGAIKSRRRRRRGR
jgi:hypothetical protein